MDFWIDDIPDEWLARIEARAKVAGRTLNDEILAIIDRALSEPIVEQRLPEKPRRPECDR